MEEKRYSQEQLVELATRLMKTSGMKEESAATIARDLVAADMRGLYSYGVSRIPMYLKRIECNCVKPNPGYCCMVYTNSSPALPVFGGRTTFLGAAPFAAGMAGGYESPAYVLDMAMTKTARGKIRVAMINNEPIAEGLALDSDGNPTTDAKKAFEGVCLPFGGPKGAGLAMLMDMLAGMYTGSNYAGDVSSLYYRFDEPQNLGHMIFIMKADMFMSMDEYKKRMDVYYKRLKALPKAAGVKEILMPGEPEDRKTEASKRDGILLSGNIQESLYLECMKRNVACEDILGKAELDQSHNAGDVVFGN